MFHIYTNIRRNKISESQTIFGDFCGDPETTICTHGPTGGVHLVQTSSTPTHLDVHRPLEWLLKAHGHGDGQFPPWKGNPYNGYLNLYYWVDDYIPIPYYNM